MISYVKTSYGVKHIAIHNYDNSFCHHIAVLQRLHSSPLLNERLSELSLDTSTVNKSDIFEVLLLPLVIYSRLSEDNDVEIYAKLKDYFTWFVPEYVTAYGRHGYNPYLLMNYFILPVVYKYFPDLFDKILEELSLDIVNINKVATTSKFDINSEQSFIADKHYRMSLSDVYTKMVESLPKVTNRTTFVSAIMEVYPDREKQNGHAVTLIKGRSDIDIRDGVDVEDYYVIDDQNAISRLSDYYNERKERIHEISIKDIDGMNIANINAIFRAKCDIDPSCKFSENVYRYSLNFDRNFNSLSTDVLKPELAYIKTKIDSLRDPRAYNYGRILSLLFIFVVGLIIGIIIGLLTRKYIFNGDGNGDGNGDNEDCVDCSASPG